MGWSLTVVASNTLDRMGDNSSKQTGMGNTYFWKGRKYFFEPDTSKEFRDGSVVGDIFLITAELEGGKRLQAVKAGRFKIDGKTGKVTRGGFGIKELAKGKINEVI